jgi:hypothetical protein
MGFGGRTHASVFFFGGCALDGGFSTLTSGLLFEFWSPESIDRTVGSDMLFGKKVRLFFKDLLFSANIKKL